MTLRPSILTITLDNMVAYQGDIYDPSQFATDPNVTTPNPVNNFFVATLIGDIKTVNGEDAKGTYFGRTRVVNSNPHPDPGQAQADVMRTAMREHFFEIMHKHGGAIGTIMSSGFSGGVAPPATVLQPDEEGNWAIMGGTGAYIGVRGQVGGNASPRRASMTEDPSRRRNHHAVNGSGTFYLHVIPADPPQIVTGAFGPLVLHHANSMPVTALTPVVEGEKLLLFASGLGPTDPDVDLSSPFPVSPSKVSSPLSVSVNGTPAGVLRADGVAGQVNVYHVLFEMPPTTPPIMSVQLTAAWMSGPPVKISVA